MTKLYPEIRFEIYRYVLPRNKHLEYEPVWYKGKFREYRSQGSGRPALLETEAWIFKEAMPIFLEQNTVEVRWPISKWTKVLTDWNAFGSIRSLYILYKEDLSVPTLLSRKPVVPLATSNFIRKCPALRKLTIDIFVEFPLWMALETSTGRRTVSNRFEKAFSGSWVDLVCQVQSLEVVNIPGFSLWTGCTYMKKDRDALATAEKLWRDLKTRLDDGSQRRITLQSKRYMCSRLGYQL